MTPEQQERVRICMDKIRLLVIPNLGKYVSNSFKSHLDTSK